MRMLLKWELRLHATNEAIRSGKMAAINEWLNECLKPEAAYFGTENGKRTGYIFFDLDDPAQIPVIAEPLFQQLESTVEFIPVMNADDLQRGLANIARD
jgi:hypothetical protein